jgi:hypothetical protein
MAGCNDPRCPQDTDLNQGRGMFRKKVPEKMSKKEMWKVIIVVAGIVIFIILGMISVSVCPN